VDEYTVDESGNPIGIMLGKKPSLPPIFVSSEIDSKYQPPWEYHYALDGECIAGAGLMDNAIGAACLLSFADFARKEGLRFDSDVYLAGFTDTMEPGRYYEGVDGFLGNFAPKIRGAVIVKGGELGRLNYFCRAIIRAELLCEPASEAGGGNMIEVAHEIIDRLLFLRTPLRPKTELIVGKISGGRKHGQPASETLIGFELHGDSGDLIQEIFEQIENIAKSIEHE
jgi:tripeptide aminopeptidase